MDKNIDDKCNIKSRRGSTGVQRERSQLLRYELIEQEWGEVCSHQSCRSKSDLSNREDSTWNQR